MKAFMAWDDNDGCVLVYGSSAGEARSAALREDGFEDDRYTDIRVRRLPQLDDLYEQYAVCGGNYWDDPVIRRRLVESCGWSCDEITDSCKTCPARDCCGKYLDSLIDLRED